MSVQKQFASLVQTAAQVRASDLYVMPGEAGYRVFCYTATGIQPLADLTLANGEALIRHIKFEAQMDTVKHGDRNWDAGVICLIRSNCIYEFPAWEIF